MAPISQLLPPVASLSGVGLLALGSVALLYIISRLFLSIPYPKGIPLIGEPDGATRFSIRTYLRFYTDCQGLFREAYDNVILSWSSHLLPFVNFRPSIPRRESR